MTALILRANARRLPLAAGSVDAVVTDPPYELGFMGKGWDASGVAYDVNMWRGVLRALRPGGHLVAFGGTRTAHRMVCAIEDAGFEIRDSITWLYASGFPKSLDVSKAIDKAAGAEREVVGVGQYANRGRRTDNRVYGTATPSDTEVITAPASPDAERWQGWGTALKPASEPIVWAQKPFSPVLCDWRLVADVHHALAGLLWLSLSPAKRAEAASTSRNPAHVGAWCASAHVSAALATSPAGSEETGTYSSLAVASTCSNIASSWSGILAALSDPTRTSTTSTASSTTTALRTLNSLLAPITSQTTMPPCGCLHAGQPSSAQNVKQGSTGEWTSWLGTLRRSVPETATEGIALSVSSALASIAAELSSGPEAESSAGPTAITGAPGRVSPASEPIVVARKPFAGTVAANVLAHGTGALNIDACRVTAGQDYRDKCASVVGLDSNRNGDAYGEWTGRREDSAHAAGRWPSNVVLSHAHDAETGVDLCGEGCVPGCPVTQLDAQSGDSPASLRTARRDYATPRGTYSDGLDMAEGHVLGFTDSGGASRFFPVFRYQAKAPASERPRVNGVSHPTVKPLALIRWLARLITPPGGLVLDMFAGSGPVAEACLREGFRCVVCEREAEYLPLIQERVRRTTRPWEPAPPTERTAPVVVADAQLGLFDGAAS